MVSIDFVSDSQQMKLYDYVEKSSSEKNKEKSTVLVCISFFFVGYIFVYKLLHSEKRTLVQGFRLKHLFFR